MHAFSVFKDDNNNTILFQLINLKIFQNYTKTHEWSDMENDKFYTNNFHLFLSISIFLFSIKKKCNTRMNQKKKNK